MKKVIFPVLAAIACLGFSAGYADCIKCKAKSANKMTQMYDNGKQSDSNKNGKSNMKNSNTDKKSTNTNDMNKKKNNKPMYEERHQRKW